MMALLFAMNMSMSGGRELWEHEQEHEHTLASAQISSCWQRRLINGEFFIMAAVMAMVRIDSMYCTVP